ncbi:contact-dependent growth inhibition system immunity protein [Curtobacterium sp. ER1/6]|uniref:contact-dependent growth inhibition system immunity protein n=1 Tax=Curtobacterium sp. ER1/6 TaxID=1891920 RepID=UPI00084FB19D|nr:contact-dependent growth inhibition system immunity protein [Curtobacterium sp. ER1/6]
MEYETFAAHFPLVRNLLEGVFHQGWRFDYDSLEELYEDVLDGRDQAARAQLADQLERFADDQDEAAVDQIFVESYTGVVPQRDAGVSARAWLLDLARRLRRSI